MKVNTVVSDIKNSLLKPSKTAKKLAGKAKFKESFILYVAVSIIACALAVIFEINSLMSGHAVEILIVEILLLIISVVGTLILLWSTWFLGKLLGGKSGFEGFYAALVYPIIGVYFATVVVYTILDAIGYSLSSSGGSAFVEFVMLQVSFLVILVSLISYLYYEIVFTEEVHGISITRAIVAVLIPTVLWSIIAFAISFIITVLFLAGS